jgi:hypothetical protein
MGEDDLMMDDELDGWHVFMKFYLLKIILHAKSMKNILYI